MSLRKEIVAVILTFIAVSLLYTNSASAQLSCSDVKYGNPDYQDNMDKLAEKAKLPDDYWNRYHEDVVSFLCGGKIKDLDELIDTGFVEAREAQNIASVLGKTYKPKARTEAGEKFGDSRKRFIKMGACNACADNIASYYTKKPDSQCGKLAKKALKGNKDAIKKIVTFPNFCN